MYQALAKFYGKLNDDCDQRAWSHYLISLLEESLGPAERLEGADLGCGTGSLTVLLSKRCRILCACDLSPEMLNEAASNFRRAGKNIPLLACDFRSFKAPHRLDFLNIADDGVNYLPGGELLPLFASLRASLKPGGLLLFDLSSPRKLREVLGNNLFFDDGEEVSMFWRNTLFEDRVKLELTFFEREGAGLYRRTDEEQLQYIHETGQVLEALREAGFGETSVYRALSRESPEADDLRLQFVAKNG